VLDKILLQDVNNETLTVIHLGYQASQIQVSRCIPVSAKLRWRQQMLPLSRGY